MGYAKVNYDDIYAASPINGTAASVVTGIKKNPLVGSGSY